MQRHDFCCCGISKDWVLRACPLWEARIGRQILVGGWRKLLGWLEEWVLRAHFGKQGQAVLLVVGDIASAEMSIRRLGKLGHTVADICRKMTTKRSESEGSSDGGGRRGQQQRRLWLRCNFVAADGFGCSKGAAAIGGIRGSDGGGRRGQQQRRLWLRCNFVAAGGFGCSKGAAAIGGIWGSDVHNYYGGGQLQRKIAAGNFLPQGSLLAAIKEDGSKRSLLAVLGSERCILRLKG
ncbi:hypothetical protein BHE74_00026673 [Ensete ventricosum]|nr:hypothetical protein BHE74_00026673 [Ensete ventricosum]